MKKYFIGQLLLIVLLAIVSFASALLARAVANAANYILNEADVHRCIIHGHNYGDTLYAMGMALWLIILTLPFAELARFRGCYPGRSSLRPTPGRASNRFECSAAIEGGALGYLANIVFA